MNRPEPHLDPTHPQYPDGFPERENDDLLGHWDARRGKIVVEHHPHGYEIHFYPCYDFECCDACAPDRGPSNPHTPDDGHHFRLCEDRGGPILTVAADKPDTVVEYLAMHGSEPHIKLHDERLAREEAEFEAQIEAERLETERTMAEEAEMVQPSPEERIAALEAELAAIKEKL